MDFDQWNQALLKGAFDQTGTSEKKPDRFYEFYAEEFDEEEDPGERPVKN